MSRTLTITAAEWASAKDGTLWIVGEGVCSLCIEGGNDHESYGVGPCAPNLPPLEFAQACAFCTACDARLWDRGHNRKTDCPDCRIELVGPCPVCAWNPHHHLSHERQDASQPLTLGYAYAAGQPLPIHGPGTPAQTSSTPFVRSANNGRLIAWNVSKRDIDITDRLAHYGPPESLVGKWALQLTLAVTA